MTVVKTEVQDALSPVPAPPVSMDDESEAMAANGNEMALEASTPEVLPAQPSSSSSLKVGAPPRGRPGTTKKPAGALEVAAGEQGVEDTKVCAAGPCDEPLGRSFGAGEVPSGGVMRASAVFEAPGA